MDGASDDASTSQAGRRDGRPSSRDVRQPRATSVPLPDGRTLCAYVWPGEGTPLVLLHGLLDSGLGWSELVRSTARPCIAFDLPGFGGSDLVARPRISSYATDILAAIATAMAERALP
jgi:pimeloyl-ACP methyl ester carboxylesterase